MNTQELANASLVKQALSPAAQAALYGGLGAGGIGLAAGAFSKKNKVKNMLRNLLIGGTLGAGAGYLLGPALQRRLGGGGQQAASEPQIDPALQEMDPGNGRIDAPKPTAEDQARARISTKADGVEETGARYANKQKIESARAGAPQGAPEVDGSSWTQPSTEDALAAYSDSAPENNEFGDKDRPWLENPTGKKVIVDGRVQWEGGKDPEKIRKENERKLAEYQRKRMDQARNAARQWQLDSQRQAVLAKGRPERLNPAAFAPNPNMFDVGEKVTYLPGYSPEEIQEANLDRVREYMRARGNQSSLFGPGKPRTSSLVPAPRRAMGAGMRYGY